MSFLTGLFAPQVHAGRPADDDDYWYEPRTKETATGTDIDATTAMQVVAVNRCVRILAEMLASLPLILYRRLPEGGKERATDQPLYGLLHDQPNSWQTSFEYIEMAAGHLALRGNAVSQIVLGSRGIDDLIPMHPDRVEKIERLTTGQLRYTYQPESGGTVIYLSDEIHHVRWFSSDSLWGLDPIASAREAIGLAKATEEHGALLFKNRCVVGGALEHPGRLQPTAAKNLKRSVEEAFTRSNKHRLIVLEEGLKYHELGMTNENAQFLETRKYQLGEIARMFGVPLFLLGEIEGGASYASVYEAVQAFVTFTLRVLARRWERAVNRDLVAPLNKAIGKNIYFAEFLFDELLRGDPVARAQAMEIELRNGALNQDQWREIQNRNPLPDGLGQRYFINTQLALADGFRESATEGPSPDEQAATSDLAFKREIVKTFAADSTAGDVIWNQLDRRKLLAGAGLDVKAGGPDPLLPVIAAQGPQVSGEELKNEAGKVVGGDLVTEPEPEPPPEFPPPGDEELPAEDETEEPGAVEFPPPPSPDAAAILLPLAENVAERLAGVEIRELEKRTDKAVEDRTRFNAWVARFFGGTHRDHAIDALAPLARAWAQAGVGEFDADEILSRIVDDAADRLRAEDPMEVLAAWRVNRRAEIVTLLTWYATSEELDDGSN